MEYWSMQELDAGGYTVTHSGTGVSVWFERYEDACAAEVRLNAGACK